MGREPGGRARRPPPRGGRAAARAHRRARPGDDARGRQAAGGELRRGGLDRRGVRLLRRDGPQLRRPRDPLDRVDPARARPEGADRRVGLHRALELPAAPARLEARAGAGGRQHGGGQAVGAHAALHADARLLLRRTCPPGAFNVVAGRRRRGRGDRARPARGRRGLHRLGGHRQAGAAALCAERVARDEPGDGRKGPVHRLRGRGRRRGRGGPGRRLGRVPERGPGVHLGRALLRGARGLRRVRRGVRGAGARRCAWAIRSRTRPTWGRWSRRGQRGEGRGPGGGGGGRRAPSWWWAATAPGRSAATSTRPPW